MLEDLAPETGSQDDAVWLERRESKWKPVS